MIFNKKYISTCNLPSRQRREMHKLCFCKYSKFSLELNFTIWTQLLICTLSFSEPTIYAAHEHGLFDLLLQIFPIQSVIVAIRSQVKNQTWTTDSSQTTKIRSKRSNKLRRNVSQTNSIQYTNTSSIHQYSHHWNVEWTIVGHLIRIFWKYRWQIHISYNVSAVLFSDI